MGFWTILLAIVLGLAAFALLFAVYALLSTPATKEQLAKVDKKLAQREVASPKPKDRANRVFPFNLIH